MKLSIRTVGWRIVPKGFEIWSESDPSVAVVDSSFSRADVRFAEALAQATGEYPPRYCFSTPTPIAPQFQNFQSDWLVVWARGDIIPCSNHLDDLYSRGICRQCGLGVGGRSTEAIKADLTNAGDLDAIPLQADALLIAYSSRLIQALLATTTADSRFTAIHDTGMLQSPKTYFEPSHPTPLSVQNPPTPTAQARSCDLCSNVWIPPALRSGELTLYVNQADLADLDTPWSMVTDGRRQSLIVHKEEWRRITEVTQFHGCDIRTIGIIPSVNG